MKELDLFNAQLSGISLVEAGAGTGKTYNIASLFIRVLLEKRLLPSQILVLTYTEAATVELKSRLRSRIKEAILVLQGAETEDDFLLKLASRCTDGDLDHLKNALYHFDEAAVSTIHGFCQRLLKERSLQFEVSSKFEILSDENELLQEIADDYWRNFIANDQSEFERNCIHFLLDQNYTPEKVFTLAKELGLKPYATLVPKVKGLFSFQKEFDVLKVSFKRMKDLFFEQEAELETILKSNALNGKRYQNRFYHFENIKTWLRSDYVPFKPHEKLFLFSSFMETDGKKKNETIPHLSFFDAVDRYFDESSGIQHIELSFITSSFTAIHSSYQKIKEEKDLLTYNDLLTRVEKGIPSSTSEIAKELRRAYPIALIDEFQDTDPIQYAIFKKIYSANDSTALFMIGDPKQAIYSFRGADINTYFKAKEDANEYQRYSLNYNFRSSKPMIEAVNKFFSNSKNPFSINELTFSNAKFPLSKDENEHRLMLNGQEEEALQVVQIESEDTSINGIRNAIAKSISSEIFDLLTSNYTIDKKPIAPNEIAILVRTHNQALEIQEALRERNIKSLIKSKESVFGTKEAQELYQILSAILTPSFENGVRGALCTEMISFSAFDLKNLSENENTWTQTLLNFLELNEAWINYGFSFMVDRLLSHFNIEEHLATFFDAERRLTNLYHLIELLKKEELQQKKSPKALLNNFRKKREFSNVVTSDDELIRLESDENLVQIVTMHASKGLEYSIVFCPYLWEGVVTKDSSIFPFHDEGKACIDIGSEEEERNIHRNSYLEDALSERLRLTYVALTRSKSLCLLYLVNDNTLQLSPLASLLEGSEIVKERLLDKISLTSPQYKSKYKDASDQVISEINAIAQNRLILIRNTKENKRLLNVDEASELLDLDVLDFTRENLDDFPRITSFSSLADSVKPEYIAEDKIGFDYDALTSNSTNEKEFEHTIYSLPKGAKTGTLLHSIFESITFDNPESYSEVVSNSVEYYGFESSWKPIITDLVTCSTNHILKDDIKLQQLSAEQILIEMEFHFPISDTSFSKLMELIRNKKRDTSHSIRGFMKGFIDLIFQHNGKYFILDYKSNHLGDSQTDYNNQSLEEEVLHSNYDLQYHIYILALHRMLSSSIPDYTYEEYFGGVFYLFLRGIETGKDGSGVFYDKPSFETIEKLDSYFKNGEEG